MRFKFASSQWSFLASIPLILGCAIAYGSPIIVTLGAQRITFDGASKRGSIVAEANGMDAINPGFDFEKGSSTSGWTSNDVQLETGVQNTPTLTGTVAKVSTDEDAKSLSQGDVVVTSGDRILVRDRAGNYMLMTIKSASPQEVDFTYVAATSVQAASDSSQPQSGSMRSSNSSGGDLDINAAAPKNTTTGTGTGIIFFARYAPVGMQTKYMNSSGDTVGQSTSQLIEVTALNPATCDIKETGLVADTHPRFTPDGRYAALYSPGSFTVLSLDNHKRNFKVNNAVVYGDAAASWSPNGRYLAFQGGGSGGGYDWESGSLYVLDCTTGIVHTILDRSNAGVSVQDVNWMPDGELVFSTKDAFYHTTDHLHQFVKIPVTITGKLEYGGRFDSSPNGKWLAFIAKDQNGKDQVWIASMDGGVPRMVTHHSKSSARSPRFSPDSGRIAYVDAGKGLDGEIRVVTIDGNGDHALNNRDGKPIPLVQDIEQWIPLSVKQASLTKK